MTQLTRVKHSIAFCYALQLHVNLFYKPNPNTINPNQTVLLQFTLMGPELVLVAKLHIDS